MSPSASARDAVIVGGNRLPFARSGRAYAEASNQDLLTAALDGLSKHGIYKDLYCAG